ncbi:DUF7017 domain-containing protein [Sulfitobacter geojensis]|uniref:DUF7017 domain-containing protein n=1 Tax=Sulfitobacter geojensis TaxID=1342299 RepID=UPI0007D8E8E3|nr:hypothetical protein [Sulfitobacter geojensis]OAN89978.1 hypothetical protein A8B74_19460 [Sulfitobacter geojensis]
MSFTIASARRRGTGGGWNHRSKEVTELRKSGQLDAAYVLSVERTADSEADDYDRGAYAWCLIALVKQHSADGEPQKLSQYLDQLRRVEVPATDGMLTEHREKTLALAQPDRRAALNAGILSKQGKHEDAARIYADINASGKLEPDDRKSWGWELYRLIKGEIEGKQDDELSSPIVQRVKRQLNTYLKLDVGGPDLLHSLMLRQALRLTKGDHLKVLPFLRLWNPGQFSDEDFTRQTGKDGKIYPALVEQVILAAASEAAESARADDRHFILPLVQDAMKRFSDNIWLKLNLTKLLRGMGRTDEALTLAVEFAREKASEYWAWELIGDLVPSDIDLKFSCYAKALICSQDDDFVGKVRLKFASLLATSYPAEARFEVECVLAHRARAGYNIPREAQAMLESAWFSDVSPRSTDRAFYARYTEAAEGLLFSHLPWTDASLGDVFAIEGKDGRKPRQRRRIYVRASPFAQELSSPGNHPDIRDLEVGAPVLVQYEMSKTELGRATIHRFRPRPDGMPMDVAAERIGVIDHINHERSLLHVVVGRNIDGTCPIAHFSGEARIGVAVSVRLAQHRGKNGVRTRILSISCTDQPPATDVCRTFHETVEITDKGFGFTLSDIFIPPNIVRAADIETGDLIEGIAVASYDKKRGKWGMKAIDARSITRNHPNLGSGNDYKSMI